MLHQPYRYKGKIAKTPIHKRIESNREFFKLEDKKTEVKRQRLKHEAIAAFKKSLAGLYPIAEAATFSLKDVARVSRRYVNKYERRAVRKHFRRARYVAAGGKKKAIYVVSTRRKAKYSYAEYIQSPEWRDRRNRFFQKFGRACSACGSFNKIHLHHMVYSAYDGTEPDAHLVALCETHHNGYHERHRTSRSMVKTTLAYVEEIAAAQNGERK